MSPSVSPTVEAGPAEVAERAAEAVRSLNHLTLAPPTPANVGWEHVGDLYRVMTEVRILVERLPQALDQLAGHLGRSVETYETDACTDLGPGSLVAGAVSALDAAHYCIGEAARHLDVAQGAVSHLYEPNPLDRGR
jgi:hypothetical protein